MLEVILFSTFGGLLLGSATMVIFASQTIQGALWLVLTFVSAASLWILLNAEFLGLILILVYVGAILTLFLFVIMTLTTKPLIPLLISDKVKLYGTAISATLALLLCVLYSLSQLSQSSIVKPLATSHTIQIANTQSLGVALYTVYAYPFELIGILLLAAIIVSISLSTVPLESDVSNTTKSIAKQDQLKADPKDRIRLVSGD